MAPVQVFVFVDFGCVKGNSENLTEVSLLAVPRSQYKDPKNINKPQDQITLNFKKMTNKQAFKKIDEFIRKFEKPVCLVAHNGIDFDFQILKRELKNLNVSLPDDLLCADSLYAFYDILKDEHKITNLGDKLLLKFNTNPLNNNCSKSNKQAMTMKDNTKAKYMKGYEQNNKKNHSHEVPEEKGTYGDSIEDDHVYPSTSKIKSSIQTNEIASDTNTGAKPVTNDYITDDKEVTETQGYESNEDLEDPKQMQLKNENTPRKRKLDATSESIDNKRQKKDDNSVNVPNPGNAKRVLDWQVKEKYKGNAVRSIFYEFYRKPQVSYKLGQIYNRFVKTPKKKHHIVENDVYMKFRISHKLGENFLDWTDQIQLNFNDVPERKIILRH